jgi:hypothetical protein
METTYQIRFEDIAIADAGQHAKQLRLDLRDRFPDLTTSVVREDPSNQDFGTTLVLILGAPAAVVLAKGLASGISAYLAAHHCTITISSDKVVARGLKSEDAAKIAEILSSRLG